MKKQTVGIVSITLLVIGVVGMRFASLYPQVVQNPPQVVPTKEITSDTSVGGIVASPPPVKNPEQSAQIVDQHSPSSLSPIVDVAPRQTEITKSVRSEYPYYALGTSNDPLTQSSWALSNTAAYTAWDSSTGNGAIVAVLDTGFALTHEDLVNQWYKNSNEMGMTTSADRCWSGAPVDKSSNACDDDANGYVDDWRGWDFVGRTNTPQAGRTDPSGPGVAHGTEVAGLVGATGNNGKGIATYGWNTRVLPLQVLGDDGSGYTSTIVAAIYYAVDRGVDVINMSLGGDTNDPALETAINYAYAHNVVVVAAAGNCGTGNEAGCDPTKPGAMGYPALNQHVIAVGASTSTNVRASFSSYGPGLDVIAPGSGTIASPMWVQSNQTSAYASSLYGTSFASPLVAGYVALVKSVRPHSTPDDITALVDGTAIKLPGMNGSIYTSEYGHGLINAQAALSIASALNVTASASVELLQTGSSSSEHSFTAATVLSSGCKTSTTAACTVWASNDRGYDRYLPYTSTNSTGAGWSWNAASLTGGLWYLRARSGEAISNKPYLLFEK